MADVKWIKLIVGMFDGMSFKKIKKAEIGGVKFRDKLTAVWFELMDFAGRCNHNGAFISPREIPFHELSDIATMIDREEEELELCMNFYVNEGMVSIVDDVYVLSNWSEYQNVDGLEKIREKNRLRKQKQREKQQLLESMSRDSHVTVTLGHATEVEVEQEKELEKDITTTTTTGEAPTLTAVYVYFNEWSVENSLKEAEKFHAYNANRGWTCLPNWKAAADLWIARIDEKGK
jgi:predicted phage replisome organizer